MQMIRVASIIGALALSAAACGGGGDDGGAVQSPPTALTAVTVNMTDSLKFEPAAVTVKLGGTVTWKNTGTLAHTVVASNSQIEKDVKSESISGEGTFQHTFDEAGTFSYFCSLHGTTMAGTVTIAA